MKLSGACVVPVFVRCRLGTVWRRIFAHLVNPRKAVELQLVALE